MGSFDSWKLFREFEDEIKNKNRFFPSEKFLKLFSLIIEEPFNKETLKQGAKLYRARRNKPSGEFEWISELGTNKANPGNNRASPVGIPYMYLADEPETAIAEIRANVNDRVTVATYVAKKDLQFISLNGTCAFCSSEEYDGFQANDILGFILYLGHCFATPIQRPEIEYLPTQYFTEYCKKQGFSGVRYVSSARGLHTLHDQNHYNYVLFNDLDVSFEDAYGYTVKGITYQINKNGIVHLKDDGEK